MEVSSEQDERHYEQGGLNPNAPEFWPSTIPSPPSLHLHYSLYLSQATSSTPPYSYFSTDHPLFYSSQTSFYYINPPPPPPISSVAPPLTSPSTGSATSFRHRYSSLKYFQLTTTTRACTHYRDVSNYNNNLIKPRRSSKKSSKSKTKANQLNQPPLHVKPGGLETIFMICNIPNQFT